MQISVSGLRRIIGFRADAIPPHARMMFQAGIPVPVVPVPYIIRFFGKAYLSVTSSGLEHEAKISFNTLSSLPPFINAFIVEDNNSKRFLIGTAEHPFPKIESVRSSGESVADFSGFSYNVSFKGPAIPCDCWLPSDSQQILI
ncbi:MAG: hypothetical protein K2J70_06740 [Muribaculaceae bacterium]|nr:hypothetical protein [Muribaculaceae bacterium]